jgi:CBS domain-containing protein
MNPQNYNQLLEAVQFHPLFQGLEQSTALSLVSECEVKTYARNEIMLESEAPRQGLMLLLKGIAEVTVEGSEVLEVVQKGEMIGFSSLADFLGLAPSHEKHPHTVEVRAVEDVDALLIPFSVISKRWGDQEIHDYLLGQVSVRLKDVYGSLAEQVKLARRFGENDTLILRVQDLMATSLASVSPDTAVQEAARVMSEQRTSSVLVMKDGQLMGIITERDIVHRVVARGESLTSPAKAIMTPAPMTVSRFAYFYEAISDMLLKGIKHLPVVEGSRTVGIVTLSDLFRKKNAGVLSTIKRIETCDEAALPEIKPAIYEITHTLIKEQVPAFTLLDLVTSLYDRVVARVVELAVENLDSVRPAPPPKFAFFQMGSSGRGEQFMLTDQDTFLVYEEGADSVYFKKLGSEMTRLLEKAGYARCQGRMMASEEQWRGSPGQWQDRVRQWMLQSTNEKLLLAQNFFSYRFVAGDEALARQLEADLKELLDRSKIFLFRLAQVERTQVIPVLDQPIRSMFKIGRKSIDMKKEVLFPYHHSLQILALLHGVLGGTPLEKIEALRKKGVLTPAFAADLKAASSQVLSLYISMRWEGKGTVLQFAALSTREKDELILSLRTMGELQSMVFARFPL